MKITKSREQIFEESIARMRALDMKKQMREQNGDECEILGEEVFEITPLPTEYYPDTRPRFSLFSFLRNALTL